VAAAAALMSACGAEADENGAAGAEPAPTTELTVTFRRARGAEPAEATLTCGPAGGTHPRPQEACAALAAGPDALRATPPDAVCTQIFGGEETATVAGVFRGQEIEATFSRENGCEISRWDALDPLLRLGS
jgi:hypothetical protein